MAEKLETLHDALTKLKGASVSSIEFLRHHIQLRFDGPCLTAFTTPTIRVGVTNMRWGEPGYFDSLCGQVGAKVGHVEQTGDQVTVWLESGAELTSSLRTEDYTGAEALMFVVDDGTWVE